MHIHITIKETQKKEKSCLSSSIPVFGASLECLKSKIGTKMKYSLVDEIIEISNAVVSNLVPAVLYSGGSSRA